MEQNEEFLAAVKRIVGRRHVLTASSATRRFRSAFRGGIGPALAVVRPGSLVEMWRVLERCIEARKAVIMQAANTGLTGGSTPHGPGCGRDLVIISGMRLNRVFPVDCGRQAICLPGATLWKLERTLARFGREPHSVLGSTCFGATVIGGICNNSGGSLVRRGPAYTEMALFAQVSSTWRLQLVNHLGASLPDAPEEALALLDRGEFELDAESCAEQRRGSDADYAARVRDIASSEPSRYNEDWRRLFETSGCAGKLAVFAVRVDAFPKDKETRVFYIGTNEPAALNRLRRTILTEFLSLPVSAEYIHRGAFDMAEDYGKEIFLAIRFLGTGVVPMLRFAQERLHELRRFMGLGGGERGGRLLHTLVQFLPNHLPERVRTYRERFEHHLLLKVADAGIEEARRHLRIAGADGALEAFECTPREANGAFLHRFVVAGAAMRFLEVQRSGIREIVPIDVALRPDDAQWHEFEPQDLRSELHASLSYGHFLCHVFHLDYILRPGIDPAVVKERLTTWLDARGARYPAEHNVGRLYRAGPKLEAFYRKLDPTNTFNPGVGQTSARAEWR
ncbi:MAG TPA: D-lactate dehydrogenase [Steroidobacteraceae bacterium]|nr:D-lactate dehydrogenase [Steroidobacteraceae bacterium]